MLIRLIAKWYSRVSQVFKLRVVTWVSWRRKLRTFQFRFRWLVTFSGGLCRDFESEEGGIEGLSLRFRAVKSPVNWRCYPNELETRKLPSRLRGLTYLNMFDLKLSLGVLSITIWGGGHPLFVICSSIDSFCLGMLHVFTAETNTAAVADFFGGLLALVALGPLFERERE